MTLRRILYGLALVVFLLSAFVSEGYFHPDEHYQLLEFAMAKLDSSIIKSLPWEFESHLRPTLQPTIAYAVISTLKLIGCSSPFIFAFTLRLLSVSLAFMLIRRFVETNKSGVSYRHNNILVFISYFLWFIPFLAARFSSENWSGLFLFWGLLNYNKYRNPLVLGLLFGFSFLFRFQIAFAILGFSLWLLFFKKEKISFWIKMALSFFVVLLLGIVIDSWFYGELVFTPWNYFYSNIVLDVASSFGTSPFYYYFAKILIEPSLLIGLLIALSLFVLLIKKCDSLYLWVVIPFLFFHSIVPHKEFRFLFPIVYLFVPIVHEAYLCLAPKMLSKRKYIRFFIITCLCIVNTIGLLIILSKPCGNGEVAIARHLHNHYKESKILVHTLTAYSPYCLAGYLPNTFYTEPHVRYICYDRLEQVELIDTKEQQFLILSIDDYQIINNINMKLENRGYILEKSSLPLWWYPFLSWRIASKPLIIMCYRYTD